VRRRILLAILLAVAVTACALGVPLGYTAMQMVETLSESNLISDAQKAATSVDQDLDSGRAPNLSKLASADPLGGEITLTLPNQEPLTYGDAGSDVISESVSVAHSGTVRVSLPAGPIRKLQAEVAIFVVLLVVLSISTGTVVATVTARRLTEPMRHVADRAIRLGAGDFRADNSRYGVAELDLVADSLDTSAGALALLVQRERDLVGDVSHQLRSRLTALQLRLETLTLASNVETAEDGLGPAFNGSLNHRLLVIRYSNGQDIESFTPAGDGSLSDSNRSVLINNARNMGLFEMHRFYDRTPPNADNLEHQWEVWIHAERLRRLAWALYVGSQMPLPLDDGNRTG